MESFMSSHYDIFIRLSIAMICGMIVGAERIVAHKTAGMRTYALVAMGSSLLVVISQMAGELFVQDGSFDPIRMASQIVVGVGFLGAGLIVLRDKEVVGLTTASGLWVCAAIGMASGFGFFTLAFMSTFLTLFIFVVLWFIEQRFKKFIPGIEKKIGDPSDINE
ncbi:MAG: MgtC/SapB family protein [Candidatus Pacebacteria bacterium]|nr:MgtC/SapB family protein [Candidatus Paceibacterota bacterium]MBP9780457.1 MgtC/SapB family protein [Candidatus Paceibacterota bacterium]